MILWKNHSIMINNKSMCGGWHQAEHSTNKPLIRVGLADCEELLLCEDCLRDYLHDPIVSTQDHTLAQVALAVARFDSNLQQAA
jgi:hypothetical protein